MKDVFDHAGFSSGIAMGASLYRQPPYGGHEFAFDNSVHVEYI